ncbi:putative toxin-antitoxin system toxin component, PIN family [Haemophilus paracuniculus]|uniref:Putative toxin-antitoxin system toxin component, PIN family n=1 Tax=Haemophilus paracuniculus TaxID=734 RepID=A0A1T0AVL5_9PAST|nr:putative toxin-antitoxin system toxin component, PIN family [Haemophilus paracuniculus]OOS00885.1 putative toxin-antitoxin system toxin component, PIN family [Haemophilus paracuniculus]
MKEVNDNYLVIDTNVLISGLISPSSKPSLAILKALTQYQVCVSNETFQEFVEVSQREKFAKYLAPEVLKFFTDNFAKSVIFVDVTEKITDCKDPKDNKFLEVALSANAKYLITGDKRDLLSMNPYKKVEIISVSEFLENG